MVDGEDTGETCGKGFDSGGLRGVHVVRAHSETSLEAPVPNEERLQGVRAFADERDPDAVYPPAFPATAATTFAAKRTPFNLRQSTGWKQLATAMSDGSSNSESTARQLDGG